MLISLGQKKTHQVRPELLVGGSDEHFRIGENSLRSPLVPLYIRGNPLPPRGNNIDSVRSIISSPLTPHRYMW